MVKPSATATAVAVTSLALVAASIPAPTPLGIGDRLFPELGNPGYDVLSYDIALRYSGDNTKALQTRTKIEAEVTEASLDRFNLDFANGKVRSAHVNGEPAKVVEAGEDIVITPATPVGRGTPLHIDIRHTSPTKAEKPSGWIRTKQGGLAMANQADAAHRVFPSNDHPSDKALFTFRITAPKELTAVTNGLPVAKVHHGGNTTWTYRAGEPMATELAQVSIDRSEVIHRSGPHGLPVRDVVPAKHRKALEPLLAKTPEQLAWMERRVGRYPLETYGVLAAEADFGFALETQTLSLFSRDFLTNPDYPDWYQESVMVHELAHQWFGNSVSPHRWSDLWLNEGHATWYEWLYAEEAGGWQMKRRVKEAYEASDQWRQLYGPPAAIDPPRQNGKISIFQPIVYAGSAVVLYALRQQIGEAAFEQVQRAWVNRHRDGVATTADFIKLAGEVSRQDLTGFLTDWLYGKKTPPMPGHPDWQTEKPVPPGKSG
ncbi:M1 family metallopeptidase [Streptomyces gobiensis]|uniref:M1 family metallopeptidase n=1 Tax=Streptomyces gobiensis TaxID=2875706 RepID=UPI001E5B2CF5|nr:M1 family metallopeptidase [Streptomyces gobiensis]UGY94006.1 M1 family metallopeptidase [Streptomyces gobiensis]